MKRPLLLTLLLVGALLVWTAPAAAQTTASVNVSATVNARAKLTLSSATVSFGDADPDTTPTITGSPVLNVDAKSRTGSSNAVTLTIQASSDLTAAGGNTIPVDPNVTWTATGDLTAGTLKTTAQTIGNWTGSGARSGAMTFQMLNSWSYATGTYSTTITFTLSAP